MSSSHYQCGQEGKMPEECAGELKVKDRPVVLSLLANSDGPSIDHILDCREYSSIHRLLRVTAHVLKFVDKLKNKANTRSEFDFMTKAEVLWIQAAQTPVAQDEKLKKQFKLFLDREGIWRCGGRLSNADIPFHVKHPILLPKKHHLTTLIVRRAHERVFHNGVKDTMSEVRSRFWVLKCRSLVKKIVHQCVVCKKAEGKPYLGPSPPPLPTFRLKEDPPFTHTGVDFAGPFYIKAGSASNKVWICLFTCCVTRAVHLEIVPDMTTSAFIRSLKRFSARRGLPRMFVSDNGKTFKAAARVIDTIMRDKDVQRYLTGVQVEWSFNLERAPWWGGVFERMVRMTKRCLKKMVGRAKLTYDELVTIVTEVEAVINSRPLSYVTSDDLEQPLTPAHLLTGRRLLSLPDSIYYQDFEDDFEVTPEHLTKRLVYLNRILDNFWARWRNEYMLELRDSHRYGGRTSNTTSVSVGDIVLVHDDSKPRGFWKLARVDDLVIGKDGRTRGATLKVASPDERGTVLRRPLQRLYLLEVSRSTTEEEESDECDVEGDADPEPQETPVPVRPRRAAAERARDMSKALAVYEQDEDSS